jgi:hypothetical protein
MSRAVRMPLALALATALAGCAGYQLGPTLGASYRSVAVVMFQNKTYQPQIEQPITSAIIRQFQSDGALRIESSANADIILTGEVTRYWRQELRSQSNDNNTPREYEINISARIEAHDRVTGKLVVGPKVVTGKAATFIGSDLQSAEEQALPLVAQDLAKKVVTLLAEKW